MHYLSLHVIQTSERRCCDDDFFCTLLFHQVNLMNILSQPTHDVIRHPYNIVLTSCAGWDRKKQSNLFVVYSKMILTKKLKIFMMKQSVQQMLRETINPHILHYNRFSSSIRNFFTLSIHTLTGPTKKLDIANVRDSKCSR